MQFKVRVRATGAERTVTAAAYAAKGPKVYEKLAVVDGNGNETAISPNRSTPQESKSVKGAAPVVVKQIEVPQATTPVNEPDPQPEVQQEQTEQKPERKKPGRKPKESISSNSDANGQ